MIQQAQRKQKTLPNLMAKNWTDIELQKNNDLNEKSNDEAVESLDELSIDSEEDYEEGDDDDEDDDEEEEDDDDEEEEDDDDEEENDEDEAEEEGGEEEEELMNKVDDWMSESQRTPEDVGKLENTIMKDRETPSYHSNPVVASKVIQLDYSSTHATFQSEISSSIHSSVSITSIDSPSPDSTHHRSLRRKNRIHSPHSLPSSPTFPSNEQSDRFLMLPSSPEPSSSTSKFRRLRRTSGLLHTSSSSSSNSMKPSSPKETVPSFTSDYRSTVGQFFDDEAEESEDDAFIRSDVDPDEDENKAEEEEEEGEEDRDLEGFVLPDDAGEDEEEQGEKRLKNSDSVRALYAKQEQEDSKAFLEQLDRSLRPSLSTSVRMLNQRTTDAFPQRSMMPSWTTPLDDFTVDSSLKPVILNPSLSTSTLSLSSTTHFSSSSPPLPTSVITRLRPPSLPMTRTTFRGKSFDPRNNLAHSEDASMAPLGLKIDGSSYHPTPVPIAGTSFTSSVTLGESNLLNVLEENKKG
ncbi:hypothetical protein HMI54_003656 [Coelomomyces lativittatus]|nr:hypothetical protein HMI54_003656 [Coelomomyces lativittatus]